MQTKQHHRLLALLLTVVMTFQFIVATPHVAFAEANTTEVVSASDEQQNNLQTEEAAEDPDEGSGYPQVRAAKGGKTVLAFTSDIHNGTASGGETNVGNNRLSTWLSNVQPQYNNSIEVFGFCGDMAAASSNSSTFWTFTKTVMDNIDAHELTGVYAVGNHEYMNGEMASTSNSPAVREKYVLNGEARAEAGDNFVIYCLGTNSSHGTSWAYDDSQITTLTNYLNSVGNDKVIIILTHFPLHNYGSHRTSNTLPVLNALNDAALGADGRYGTSDDKKIVFLWGHNHSEGDTNYDEVWQPEDKINNDNSSTVYFFYAAAGSMADSEYGSSGRIKGKGLVLEIDGDNNNRLSFSYYDANGNNVTEPDSKTITEASHEPVAIEGVSITNSNPTVKVGRTLQLKYSTTPSDATVDSVTWSSSNTSIATVNESGKVTGVAEGSATIALSVSDGLSKATRSTSVVVNVTEGGSEEYTVNVTPTTSNPEQSIQIEVGDTLVINTTNGSSNSAYDFTATLSNSGVAEFQGSSSARIAAGSSAAFTVEGTAEGTVDIVIQNSNSYSSQYVRKATIHLTVGSGSSSEDPQPGDTVSITPSTDNPEQSISIKVGDTLTIDVTNGSTNSAYDFTATFSKSGIAEIQGNATINIAKSGTGQYKIKGLTEGTTDIIIQNENSYGSEYVRKGTIHLTVGDGSTPVDPPVGDAVTYELASTLEDGGEYLIVNTNAVGSAYALKNPGGTSDGAAIANSSNRTAVTIKSGSVNYIETNDTDIVWTATANSNGGFDLTNNGDYLEGSGGSVSVFNPQNHADRYWSYSSSDHYLQHIGGQNTPTLRYSSSNNYFQGSTSNTNAVYLFKKTGEDVPVTGIILNKNTLRLSAGESETLTVTLTPADSSHKTVTWNSSNTSVATVSNGVVTALAAGTATITATSADGPSATCNVIVTAAQTVTYTLTDKLEAGKEYLIATANNGSAFILSSETGSVTDSLKGYSVSVADGKITIPAADAEKTVFECVQNPSSTDTNYVRLMNGGKYLYADGNGALRMVDSISDNGKNWHYRDADKYVLWFYNGSTGDYGYTATGSYKYYLQYDSNGNFTKGIVQNNDQLADANTPKIYIFEKSEQQSAGGECTIAVTANKSEVLPGDTVTFTVTLLGPVSNFGSMNMELDIPAGLSYVTGTGKLADNLRQTLGFDEALDDGMGVFFDENTLMISGCGTKNYSSQDDTVLATFDCTIDNSFSGPATVTLKEELEVGDVENWVLLEASAIGADITLHVHEWEVSWNWTGSDASGYTAAAATIACKKDPTHTQTVTATVESSTPSSGEDAGYTVYTATVTAANSPDGTAHTDKKRVLITYTISYELDGGSVATANPTAYTVESDPITLNNPIKTGCTFLGWTGTGLGSATTTVTIAKGSTGDRSYTATWRVDGYEISGNITSYIGLNPDIPDYVYEEGKVSVVLYSEGSETVVATAVVSDDNKTYTLTGIANGTYDLKVTKKDHAPRTYTISVSDGAVTQDVIIRLYGDMNGDGKLTTFDAGRINSHAQGKGLLEGYDLIVADVLGPNGVPDGEVSTADAGRVNSHVMAGKLLW